MITKIIDNNDTYTKIKLCYTTSNSLEYSLSMSKKVYDRLKKKLLQTCKYQNIINVNNVIQNNDSIDSKFDEIIYCLYSRYNILDSKNQQLAIIEEIKEIFFDIGFNFELFGSSINTYSRYYCSLFPEIEGYFGSYGNFFDIDLKQGLYWCNPPYDDTIMTETGKKINKWLSTNNNLIFLITIPIWDKETQINLENYQTSIINDDVYKNDKKYDDFEIYKNIKFFVKKELIIPKNRIPYFNYKRNVYIYAVNSYLLLLYNDNIDDKYIPIINKINNAFELINNNDKNNLYINKDKKHKNSFYKNNFI